MPDQTLGDIILMYDYFKKHVFRILILLDMSLTARCEGGYNATANGRRQENQTRSCLQLLLALSISYNNTVPIKHLATCMISSKMLRLKLTPTADEHQLQEAEPVAGLLLLNTVKGRKQTTVYTVKNPDDNTEVHESGSERLCLCSCTRIRLVVGQATSAAAVMSIFFFLCHTPLGKGSNILYCMYSPRHNHSTPTAFFNISTLKQTE